MTLNLTLPDHEELKPRITVFGVGGAGGNAVNNMIEKQLDGVEFVVANTDAQALQQSSAPTKIQMGIKVTEGLGAGAKATVGAAAAEESIETIVDHLAGSHMCFITAGMGGGTGTGAAPIIAQAARELGVLTVGVVTKPFQFEGVKRMTQANAGVEALQKVVDTLIIIPNQNLFRLANENTTFTEAFSLADDVLYQGVKGVTDLMVRPGLINLDFADVRAVMDEMGKAMMGTGEATGEDRAVQAADKAVSNPLLDEISLRGARGVLINITGGHDLTLFELDEAANRIREEVDQDANIIVGSTLDTNMNGAMRVSVVATGIDVETPEMAAPAPTPIPVREEPAQVTPTFTTVAPAPAAAPRPVPQAHAADPRRLEPTEIAAAPPQEPAAAEPAPAATESFSFIGSANAMDDDDLPPPAYDPERFDDDHELHVEDTAQSFIAPQPSRPGNPSQEALARLKAAVDRTPDAGIRRPEVVEDDGGRSRFGINSLINRMTGNSADSGRQEPTVGDFGGQDHEQSADDRAEIPAFLRRQAN